MMHDKPTADCGNCEQGTVKPFGVREYVCNICDSEMSASRFKAKSD